PDTDGESDADTHTGAAITALYPNPIGGGGGAPSVTVVYRMAHNSPPATAPPTIEVFDVLARQVAHQSTPLSAGVYFVRLHFDDGTRTDARTIVVAKSGPVRFNLRHDGDPTRAESAATPAAKSAAPTSAQERLTTIRFEKGGFVTEEVATDLSPGSSAEVN